jgi:opacity protein-like surface antigen
MILPLFATTLLLGGGNTLFDRPMFDSSESHPDSTYALVVRQVSEPESSTTYLRFTGGLVTTKDSSDSGEEIDFDEGWLASVGFGKRVANLSSRVGFSLELDGIWTDQDTDQSGILVANVTDINVAAVLLNGLIDFPIVKDALSIYAGAGIGAAWLDVGGSGFDEDDGPFLAWQGKAGLSLLLSKSVALHVGYRFLNVDDAELDDDASSASFDLETRQHVLEAGLIFGL